ncbi:hypothetical protein ACQ4PT_007329 [Festuca glaucescens]
MSPPTRTWRQHTTRRGGLRQDVIDSATPPPTSSRRRCDAGRAAQGHRGLHYAAANELEEQAVANEKMEAAHVEAGAWRDYSCTVEKPIPRGSRKSYSHGQGLQGAFRSVVCLVSSTEVHNGRLRGQDRSIVEDKLDFKGGNVHVITTKEDWDQKVEEANKDGKIVVANFSASWCGPCRVIAPVYAEMSKTYPQLMFLTIDVDDLMDFSSTWDIRATPTFFFLKNGQQIDKLVGANRPELEKKVQALGDGS